MAKTDHEMAAEQAISVAYITLAIRKYAGGYYADHITSIYISGSVIITVEAPAYRLRVFKVTSDNKIYAAETQKDGSRIWVDISLIDDSAIIDVMDKFTIMALDQASKCMMSKGYNAWDTWTEWAKKYPTGCEVK